MPDGGQRRDFPDGFFWGAATAAHQVEGGNTNNDWWAWEHAAGTTATESSGDGIDHFHRYAEDFALLAGLGHNAHRFSLEWSRIEPAHGEWSRAALDHYRRVILACRDAGMMPFVTLQHFTLPQWFAAEGGWGSHDAVARYRDYVQVVADALGDVIPYACSINEPQAVALMGYLVGDHPPGLREPAMWQRVTDTLRRAHDAAVDVLAGGPAVGLCLQMPHLQPARQEDHSCLAATAELQRTMIDVYLEDLRGDFVGVQYYTRIRIDPAVPGGFARPPQGSRLTQMGWEVYSEGLHEALVAAARTGLPVIVTENGIATDHDDERIDYLEQHLQVVHHALRAGVDLRGYLYWSAFDNYEWAEGYRPHFGLVGIDRANGFQRQVRASARAFGRVAATGRVAALRSG